MHWIKYEKWRNIAFLIFIFITIIYHFNKHFILINPHITLFNFQNICLGYLIKSSATCAYPFLINYTFCLFSKMKPKIKSHLKTIIDLLSIIKNYAINTLIKYQHFCNIYKNRQFIISRNIFMYHEIILQIMKQTNRISRIFH